MGLKDVVKKFFEATRLFWLPLSLSLLTAALLAFALFSKSWGESSADVALKINGTHTATMSVSVELGVWSSCVTTSGIPSKLSTNICATSCPFISPPFCGCVMGAFTGVTMGLAFALLASLMIVMRRFTAPSDMVYGITCFCCFGAGVLPTLGFAYWLTALSYIDVPLYRASLPSLPSTLSPSFPSSPSYSLGPSFAISIISSILMFVCMYLTAFYGFPPTPTPPSSPTFYASEEDGDHELSALTGNTGAHRRPRRLMLMD